MQEVMVELDRLQDPYLFYLDLTTSEYLNIYNKEVFRLPENDRYGLTRSKWTFFTKIWRMLYPYLDS